MRDPYQPGAVLVLPSGRRVRIDRVRGDVLACRYETPRPGDRRHGAVASDPDMVLTRTFCDRHTFVAVPV